MAGKRIALAVAPMTVGALVTLACGTLDSSPVPATDASTPPAPDAASDAAPLPPPPPPAIAFDDVPPGDPSFASLVDVLDGCDATHFCPDAVVTRRDLYRWAVRIVVGDGFPDPPSHFDDIGPTDKDYRYAQEAGELGLSGGCAPRAFCPDDPVARIILSVVVVQIADKGAPDGGAPSFFADEADAGGLAIWMNQSHAEGLQDVCRTDLPEAGSDGGTRYFFCPKAAETRRSAVVALARARALRH